MLPSSSPNDRLKELAYLLVDKTIESTPMHSELLTELDFHGITLLAAEQNTLPAYLTPHLAKHKAMMVANDKLKQIELATLFKAFDDAGLNAVLFKGSALAYSLYSKPWLRPRSDNDILIAHCDLVKFDKLFTKLGYQKLFAIQGKYVSYQSTYAKPLIGSSVINIDLHWHINNRQMFSRTFSITELASNGQHLTHFDKTPLNSVAIIPSTTDSLLIACVHRSGHHNKEERLIWLYDIHLLANSLNAEQWAQLCRRAKSKLISSITLNALETCQQLFETQIDEHALQQLHSSVADHEPSAIFLNDKLSERHYFCADLKSMPTFSAKLGFIRENIIPSPTYVRQQMNTPWASVAYLKRLFRGIKRVF